MSWSFRRSIRLPGGMRINVSRRGLGYSWGVPGVHFGQDASGRNYQAYSAPGTGIYSRSYSKSGQAAATGAGPFWKWFGLGIFLGRLRNTRRKSHGYGCLLLLLILALPLMLLQVFFSFLHEIPIPLLVVVGIFSIVLLVSRHFQVQIQREEKPVSATDSPVHEACVQPLGTSAPSVVPQQPPAEAQPASQKPGEDCLGVRRR